MSLEMLKTSLTNKWGNRPQGTWTVKNKVTWESSPGPYNLLCLPAFGRLLPLAWDRETVAWASCPRVCSLQLPRERGEKARTTERFVFRVGLVQPDPTRHPHTCPCTNCSREPSKEQECPHSPTGKGGIWDCPEADATGLHFKVRKLRWWWWWGLDRYKLQRQSTRPRAPWLLTAGFLVF